MDGIQVYLASQYETRYSLKDTRAQLMTQGIIVQSSWIDSEECLLGQASPEHREAWIQRDLSEINAADIMVCFSLSLQHGWGTGGRHVELGYAIALGKPIILVGAPENLFHYHRLVQVVPIVGDLGMAILARHHTRRALG